MSSCIEHPEWPAVVLMLLVGLYRYSFRVGDRKRTDWMVVVAAAIVPFILLADVITIELSALVPMKYDLYVYAMDGLLGFEPSFVLGRFLLQHQWLTVPLLLTYNSFSVAIAAVFLTYLWLRPESETGAVVKVFALDLLLSVPIYLAIPVCGPRFAFSSFPAAQHGVVPHLLAMKAQPNGVPSVHFATALLVAWFVRHWPVGRIVGPLYVLLTMVVTLGSGQHYLFDLIVAVPYALMVYRLGWKGDALVAAPARPILIPSTQEES